MTKERAIEIIREKYPNIEIEDITMQKLNMEKKGLKVNLGTVSPVFYYEEYTEESLKKALETEMLDLGDIENAPVIECAVNIEKNKKMLEKTDYRVVCDLAIIKRKKIGNLGYATLPKGIESEVTEKDYVEKDMVPLVPKPEFCFKIITNKNNMYGAGVIGDTEYLKKIYEEYGNFYIIPFSIHEIVVLSNYNYTTPDVKTMIDMIRGINRTVVKPEDFLSDNLYIFNGEEVLIKE